MANEYSIDGITLKHRIEAMPEDCILFRSDFPKYHTEFVGSVLSELTTEGMLVKIAHGIYAKPRRSKFGVVLPSVDKVVQAIAARDNAEVLPSGMTALNALGFSYNINGNYSLTISRTLFCSLFVGKTLTIGTPVAFENKQFGQQQKTYKNHKRSKHISKRRSENRQATGAVKNSVTYIHKSDKDKRQQPNNSANNKSKP